MRKRSIIAILGVILLLLGLKTAVAQSHHHRARPAESAIEKLFRSEVLGSQVPYLEHSIGPAFRVEKGFVEHEGALWTNDAGGSTRVYVVSGCQIRILADGDTIVGLGMKISRNCTFNLNTFFPGLNFPPLDSLTFGQFDNIVGTAEYSDDCLWSCGNCCDPYVHATWSSPHVFDFLEVVASADTEEEPALSAGVSLGRFIRGVEGEQYINYGRFNCDRKYNSKFSDAFKEAKISEVWVFLEGRDKGICG